MKGNSFFKIVKIAAGLVLVGGFALLLYSFGWLNLSHPRETYGSIGTSDVMEVTMSQVREGLDTGDKIVAVEGRIVEECNMGTWFKLECDKCEIMVKLDNASIVLPKRTGRLAKVCGVIRKMGKGFYLEGYQIEF